MTLKIVAATLGVPYCSLVARDESGFPDRALRPDLASSSSGATGENWLVELEARRLNDAELVKVLRILADHLELIRS